MRSAVVSVFVITLLFLSGCTRGEGEGTTPVDEGGGTSDEVADTTPVPPPPPPPPTRVKLRVIHAATTASKVPFGATIAGEDGDQALAEQLAFGATSAYSEATLAPGATELDVAVTAEGFEASWGEQPVSDGASHTAVVFSVPDAENQLDMVMTLDDDSGPEEGMRARFFHALIGWEAVDVCAPGATAKAPSVPVFAGVDYGGFSASGYQDVPAETKALKVRVANEETPCSGKVIGGVQLRPPAKVDLAGKNLTLIAVGRAKGRPAVAKSLLVCTDAPDEELACLKLPVKAR